MAASNMITIFWGFVRYLMNNPYQSIEEMTKKDFLRYVEEYAVANAEDLDVAGGGAAECYDDALVTAATLYDDLQLPGVTGADFDSANTFAKKVTAFSKATYPGVQEGVATHATVVTYDIQTLNGL